MEREYSLFELLRRPNVKYEALQRWSSESAPTDPAVREQVEISAKYAGYIERQNAEVLRQRSEDSRCIPPEFDPFAVHGLSKEVQQKLAQHRPETVGQASRIQGVTPAAISLLLVHLKRHSAQRTASEELRA